MKVLHGENYTQSRFAGIMHESWLERGGTLISSTWYGDGAIKTNSITNEVGLVVDTESPHFGLTEPHLSRLVEVVEGDGWNDTQSE